VKPAIVLLLLLRLDRAAGARELADLLGLDEHTVAKYLRTLGKLNLVVRTRHRGGYQLLGDPRGLFGAGLTVNEFQFRPASSNDHIYKDKKENLLTAAVDQITGEVLEPGQVSPETIKALRSVGIGEPKRSMLARLEHVTPAYIQAWHAHLGHVKGDAYRPGLLIHVLETGDPEPEVSENGHPLDCKCRECNPVDPFICPECCQYPCDCE
jgi:biotin operon repressor